MSAPSNYDHYATMVRRRCYIVMAWLVQAIPTSTVPRRMAGSSPAMTMRATVARPRPPMTVRATAALPEWELPALIARGA